MPELIYAASMIDELQPVGVLLLEENGQVALVQIFRAVRQPPNAKIHYGFEVTFDPPRSQIYLSEFKTPIEAAVTGKATALAQLRKIKEPPNRTVFDKIDH